MRPIFVLLLLLPLLATVSAFSPSVTVECAVGPEYTFNITGQSTSGVIFVDGRCAAKDTNADPATYTFASGDCAVGNGIPALGTEFNVVVQEFSTLNLESDLIVNVTCDLDLATITETTSADTNGLDSDSESNPKVKPITLTAAIMNADGTAPLVSGNVGDSARLVVSMDDTEYSVFGFEVLGLDVKSGDAANTVTMISAGCSLFPSVIPHPSAVNPDAGKQKVTFPFKLFVPKDAKVDPSLPSTSASVVTFDVNIEVCAGACVAAICTKRKRRSLSASNSTYGNIGIANTLLVYPPGRKISSYSGATTDVLLDDVCISRTPIIGVLVALSVALIVCLAITAVMFCKLRKPARKGDRSPYENTGYKA